MIWAIICDEDYLKGRVLVLIGQGLAYSVSGGWNSSPLDHPGLFVAGGETASPAEFLTAVEKVLEVGGSCLEGEHVNGSCLDSTRERTAACVLADRVSYSMEAWIWAET